MKIFKLSIPFFFVIIFSSFFYTSAETLAQEREFIHKAIQGSIFIYDSKIQPCSPPKNNERILPLGSGFIVGLEKKVSPNSTNKKPAEIYKLLITANHVIGNRNEIIIRMNRSDIDEFTCFEMQLLRSGPNKNVFLSKSKEVDLIAINIPNVPNTHPTIFDYSLILNNRLMKKWEVQEGTEIFTVGYLYGYSGEKQNYPVLKFGKIAMLSTEKWYQSPPPRNQLEEAYLVELQNVPGLSGAPIMVLSPQIRLDKDDKLQYRKISPLVVGIVKGLLKSPVGGTQGVAAIEPAYHLKSLLKRIADSLMQAGIEIELIGDVQ